MIFTAKRPPRGPYDHIRPIMSETQKRVIANNINLTTPPPRSGRHNRPATSPALLMAALLALLGLGLLFRGMI